MRPAFNQLEPKNQCLHSPYETRTKVIHKNVRQGCHKVRQSLIYFIFEITFEKSRNPFHKTFKNHENDLMLPLMTSEVKLP